MNELLKTLKQWSEQIKNQNKIGGNNHSFVGDLFLRFTDFVSKLSDNKADKTALKTLENKVDNLDKNNKGYFSTIAKLKVDHSNPQNGWYAYVGETGKAGTIWEVKDSVWEDSKVEIPKDTLQLDEFAKNGGSEKTVKELEEGILAIESYLPKEPTEEEIQIDLGVWEMGSWSIGKPMPATNRIRTTDFTSTQYNVVNIILSANYKVFIEEYDSNKAYIKTSSIIVNRKHIFDTNSKYFRVALARIDSSSISLSESVNIKITKLGIVYVYTQAASVEEVRKITGTYPIDNYMFAHNQALSFNGKVVDPKAGFSVLSKIIDAKDVTHVIMKGDYIFNAAGGAIPLHGYLSDNTGEPSVFQSDIIIMGEKLDINIQLPPEIKYIRFFLPTSQILNTEVIIASNGSTYNIIQEAVGSISQDDKLLESIWQYTTNREPKEAYDWTARFKRRILTGADIDRSFPFVVQKGAKLLLMYFTRTSHDVNDWSGQRRMITSLDFGKTWSKEVILPDGMNITGGYRVKKGTNQNTVFGVEVFLDRSQQAGYFERARPLKGSFDDIFNSGGLSGMVANSYLAIPPASGVSRSEPNVSSKIVEHKGVLYMCGYDNLQSGPLEKTRSFLVKSIDYGITWQYVSSLSTNKTGECSIVFMGERLMMVSRCGYGSNLDTENNWISYSDDYGESWATKRMTGYNVHNPQLFVWNNTMYLMGRLVLPSTQNSLGILAINNDLNVQNIAILDYDTQLPSFHQDFIILGGCIRIFTHKYITSNRTSSYIYSIDVPLMELSRLREGII